MPARRSACTRASLPTICVARPITTRARTTSRSRISTTRLRIGPPSGIIFHNRGNAWRSKGEYAKAIADYDQSIKLGPPSAFSWQNRGISKRALGDLDGALADINEAIRLDPALPQPLTNRAVIWRAKGDLDRAIADTTEAIRLARAKAPVNIMTPPGSVLISAYAQRAPRLRGQGRYRPRQAGLCCHAAGSGLRRRQQGQPGHCEGSPVAIVRAAAARAANGNRRGAAASRQSRASFAGGRSEPAPARRSGAAQARRDRAKKASGASRW